jgi:hypothetical protein
MSPFKQRPSVDRSSRGKWGLGMVANRVFAIGIWFATPTF